MSKSLDFIRNLVERDCLFHFDDNPAEVINCRTGRRCFTDAEIPSIREGVDLCHLTLPDPFAVLCGLTNGETMKVSFEFNGCEIENPTMSECGRFSVSPEYYGFEVYGTGGPCTAWRKTREDGLVLMLTDWDDQRGGWTHEFKDGDTIMLALMPSDEDDDAEEIATALLKAGAA
jgi:hypothetical protein